LEEESKKKYVSKKLEDTLIIQFEFTLPDADLYMSLNRINFAGLNLFLWKHYEGHINAL
jgi:hypothetical protein